MGLRLGRAGTTSSTRRGCRSENFRGGRGADARRDAAGDGRAGRAGGEDRARAPGAGVAGEPVGVDMLELTTLEALQRAGIAGRRRLAGCSGAEDQERRGGRAPRPRLRDRRRGLRGDLPLLRPGVHEHKIVARAQEILFELGSEQVEAINAVSGDRCNPHPHVFSDRLLRPGDQAFFDVIHSFMGYRTCYYRTFNVGGVSQPQLDAYKQCREWLDAAIDLVRPGATTDEIASVWPTAQELGFPDEDSCFGLQFGHGVGVGLYEPPMISRVHSLDCPIELEEGMVFALETYCAATDGRSAARIEEELVVTKNGNRVLTRFPAEELLVAGKVYVRGADLLEREQERSLSHVGRVQDRVVIVTGGAGRHRRCRMRRDRAEGGKVVVADLDAEAARAVADQILAEGGSADSTGSTSPIGPRCVQ